MRKSSTNYVPSSHWRFREPPRASSAEQFELCASPENCTFGVMCVRAHSEAELAEWNKRESLKQRQTQEQFSDGASSLREAIRIQLKLATDEKSIMRDHIDGIDMYADSKTIITLNRKSDTAHWIFTVRMKMPLAAVSLIDRETTDNFSLQSIVRCDDGLIYEMNSGDPVEWNNPEPNLWGDYNTHKITVFFKTDSYGTYKQRLVLSMSQGLYLFRDIKVTVQSVQITTHTEELSVMESLRWESLSDVEIVRTSSVLDSEEERLQSYYRRPENIERCIESVLAHRKLSRDNYKQFYHSLLYIEEIEQYSQLSKLQMTGIIDFTRSYKIESTMDDTTSYASAGSLFGKIPLGSRLSEDTVQGRILLQNVNFVLITSSSQIHPEKVFECKILGRGKAFLMLKITSSFIKYANIEAETSRKCQIQFVVNRIPFCEMHWALDHISTMSILYPKEISKPAQKQRVKPPLEGGVSLNAKQMEGLMAMTSPTQTTLPPVLMIGPFGTGKTLTLAQSVIRLINDASSRILICTHSNSAADLYVKDYLHPYLTRYNRSDVRVVRILYKHRWIASVSPTVKRYALMDENGQSFRLPTADDLSGAKVVVSTLTTCFSLSKLNLPPGFFTHIMIDEAAQVMELETLIPLVMANENTKIILAGDHMQMNPEVFSTLTRKYHLHDSLFERLAHTYADDHLCKITLNVNYRSHEALVKYSSDIFYGGKLEAGGQQARHPVWYPLTFIAARGEGEQHKDSTGYFNVAEVYEAADFISDLADKWPVDIWGRFDENSIGVVLPYTDQVTMLRSVLRKKDSRLASVSVERVFNVQGKQFRVLMINTVRTHHSCIDINEEEADFGFLSNPKLINTAITRAQSLAIIIGDPFSLCSVGKCRRLWIRFLEQCYHNGSLYGVTFPQIQDYIDYMDIEKAYKLNPKAKKFVPVSVEESAVHDYGMESQDMNQRSNPYGVRRYNAPAINTYNQYGVLPQQQMSSQQFAFSANPREQMDPPAGNPYAYGARSVSTTDIFGVPIGAADIGRQASYTSTPHTVSAAESATTLDFLADLRASWQLHTSASYRFSTN